MLSVVIPSYNEAGLVLPAARCIAEVLTGASIDYELLFVDDGSRDGTWDEIQAASRENPAVRGLRFSRNFGKEAAMFAGLQFARGACCAVMDCDLQHPPETLVEMVRLWTQGYAVVNGVKADRGRETAAHGLAARCFNALMSRAAHADMSRASDFKLLDRRVVDALLALPERKPFFRGLVGWAGYRSADVPFEVQDRAVGKTHFSTLALTRYALTNLTAFSCAPMQIVSVLGGLCLAADAVLGLSTLVRWARGGLVSGYTAVILVMLLLGGILMLALGVIGYYIAQLFLEVKARPRYLVDETCGEGDYAHE